MSRNVFPCTSPALAIPGRGWKGRGGLGPRGLGGVGGSKPSPHQVLSRVCSRGLDTLGRRRRRIRTQMTHSDWSRFPGGSQPGPDIALLLLGTPAPSCCCCVAQNFGFLATQSPPHPHQSRPLALFASSSTWLAGFETRP